MTIREFAEYLLTLPDQDAHVAFAEWHEDGWHYATPLNLPSPERRWSISRHGLEHDVVLNWDNCLAHKIPERLLKRETAAV